MGCSCPKFWHHQLLCLLAVGCRVASGAGDSCGGGGTCGVPADTAGSGSAAGLQGGWARLCTEVAELRVSRPDFVVRLGDIYEARQHVDGRRRLQLREQGSFWGASRGNCSPEAGGVGPWRLKVDLAAPGDAPAVYGKHHRAILGFTAAWPTELPTVRFAGKIQTCYATDRDARVTNGPNLHTSEANGLLLRRMHEAAGHAVSCMWRQTGGCASDGSSREPWKDLLCSADVPLGASGFCDCDGDGAKGDAEPGYGCDATPGRCDKVCSVPDGLRKPPTLYRLGPLLELIHGMFGSPLDPMDRKLWHRASSNFEEDMKTELKYKKYGRRNPLFFGVGGVPDEQMIVPKLRQLISEALAEPSRRAAREKILTSGLVTEIVDGAFTFRLFTAEFCALVMEELRHFYGSKLPARRPNSMNNYGIILNDIGLEPFIFGLQDAVIQPLAAILLPAEGSELESHHAFTIRYRGGEDTHLDIHTDDSDVTMNVNIFGNYTGAPLVFCGLNGAPDHRHFQTEYMHKLGYAVLHRGNHRHGAEDITSGERMNLIVWSYSYNYRSSKSSKRNHQKERSPPDTRCVSYTHDRDFGRFRTFPPGKKDQFLGRGWCPPRGKEYDGFVPDVPDGQAQEQSGQ